MFPPLAIFLMLALPISAEPEIESVTLRGTVVELTDALGKLNLKADAEPIAASGRPSRRERHDQPAAGR